MTVNLKNSRAESTTYPLTASGGVTIGTTCALADGVPIAVGTTLGTVVGLAVSSKVGFHGATPVVQRAGAAQAAVSGATATLSAYGFQQAQADALVSLVNEIRATLVEKGLMKGTS